MVKRRQKMALTRRSIVEYLSDLQSTPTIVYRLTTRDEAK